MSIYAFYFLFTSGCFTLFSINHPRSLAQELQIPEKAYPFCPSDSRAPGKPSQTSPLPLISLAHPSKLTQSSESRRHRLKAQKKRQEENAGHCHVHQSAQGVPGRAPGPQREAYPY
ncbi:unnamed protein product [Phaedon cochleariae]|uniref:Uncharacterized protein n=1 Tax=Phaedon cochleariae TaxID=80249 RepID=A0A9N9SMH6_PHACE|nr:unnamed protein product [Phaedon cochleariae]